MTLKTGVVESLSPRQVPVAAMHNNVACLIITGQLV